MEAEEAAGTQAEAEEAESALEGIATAQQASKRLTAMCLPTTTDVLAAQQHDAITQSYRAQLIDLRTTGGKAKLRAQGIDEKRICELSQYTLDENQVLRYSPALAHYYNSEGLPCDADGALIAPTTVTEDRERAMIVVPKVLQHAVMYLHHYPRLAAHPGWADMLKRIQHAGYTWNGLQTSCKQMCRQCRVCFNATRTQQHKQGLYTSRRYKRPFEALSWDYMEFGHASDSGMRSILTIMCEHTGFVELHPMETGQATAERAADALVVFILRWGTPDTMWQAHDSQLQSEVVRRVCERLDIKIMSTTPYNKNATAKQERKHLLVAQILKRLHGGHPNTGDQRLPLAQHRLRNSTLVHAG